MPCTHPFPKAAMIQQIITDLLGREVTVARGTPQVIERDTPVTVADYVSDGDELGAVVISDLFLSNALGAALTMGYALHTGRALESATGAVDRAGFARISPTR